MNFLRHIMAIVKKDLVAELREPDHTIAVLLFGLLLLMIFSFALSVEPELMRRMAPGIYWLAVLFSALLTLNHSFQRECHDGQWEGLLLFGISAQALYLGKMVGNLSMILLLQLLLLPLMSILFDVSLSWPLITIIILGNIGITTLGTMYAGLTSTLRGGQALLPLLLFPMLVPVILAATEAARLVLANDLFGQRIVWLELLILFDIVFFLGSVLCAEAFFDRT